MSRQEVNLAFEALEPKILLTGNVTVEATGAGLKITGDVESNDIEIARVNADTVSIIGAGGTTVNGAASSQFALGGSSVKLDFKQGGNDLVSFVGGGGADLELNKVKGRFGNGNDEIHFRSTNIAQQVDLKMGDGENLVTVQGSSLRGKVRIETGRDNDDIFLVGGSVETLGKTRITTGEGLDEVLVSGFGTAGILAQLTVDLGSGDDEFLGFGNRIVGKATLGGGDGDDTSSGFSNTFAPGSPIVTSVENGAGQWV